MGRDTKIGLAIVGVLALTFTGLLVKKFIFVGPGAMSEIDSARNSASHPAPAPANDKPTVVMAQKDSPAAAGKLPSELRGPASHGVEGETPADMPRGSYLPADSPAENRYARQQNPAAVEEDGVAGADANPFGSRIAGRTARDATAEDVDAQAPHTLDVGPDGAAALDARKPPARASRNPLRRLSAEVPLDETPTAADLTLDNLDPPQALPVGNEPTAAADPQSAQQPEDSPAADPLELPRGDSFDAPVAEPAEASAEPAPMPAQPRSRYQMPAAPPADVTPEPAQVSNGTYTIQPNDSLWKISEKVYGNGRYFKAIGEHNRAKLPQADRLTVGTVISVPPAGELEQDYPSLCPKQRRSAVVKSRSLPAAAPSAAAASAASGGDVYVVAEGDTLFDIARYELGKASRWGEIYALNRDALGEDFDYLQPGLELKMPAGRAGSEAISRQPNSRYQR